ncbi:hypothetical protein P3339_11685 [Microbulbifer sp. MLAF003]|uniref:hypothetical protein n=1 Tax=Microbulbifer sp. MLAF003 TaxID=3032582 RepID=UPI0024AE81A7|nr:hypothetical protein [Microbulbifer sp. MLAF003]WHI53374.1 hypothetical protein P3339_11685 [Microbulbifer sp. MLAF003]
MANTGACHTSPSYNGKDSSAHLKKGLLVKAVFNGGLLAGVLNIGYALYAAVDCTRSQGCILRLLLKIMLALV